MSYDIKVRVVNEADKKTDTQPKEPTQNSVSPSAKPSQIKQTNATKREKKEASESQGSLGTLLKQASPIISSVAVTYKAIEKVGQVAQPMANFYSSYTGDYSVQMEVSNFNTMWKQLSHPVSTTINYYKNLLAQQQLNKKQALQQELLGEADLGNEGTYNV